MIAFKSIISFILAAAEKLDCYDKHALNLLVRHVTYIAKWIIIKVTNLDFSQMPAAGALGRQPEKPWPETEWSGVLSWKCTPDGRGPLFLGALPDHLL